MLLAMNGATTMTSALLTDLRAAAENKYDLFEIWAKKLYVYWHKHATKDLRKEFDKTGVKPYSINSIEFITFKTGWQSEAIRIELEKLCEAAKALKCPNIVVVPSPKPRPDISLEEVHRNSVKTLLELSDLAKPYGVNLAFEFLGFEWCSVRTVAQTWAIVKEVNRDNVGMVIDTFHFYVGGSTLESIREVDPHKIFIFHINDSEDRPRQTLEDKHRLLPGEGVIPLKDILTELKSIGFDRMTSIELFRPEYWAEDPVALCRRAKEKTMQVIKQVF
jgi:2-keto-myo-inositol isomerase